MGDDPEGFRDPAAQSSKVGAAMPSPAVSFEGIPAGPFVPPDTVGDVGPSHYVQMVNVQLAVYSKSGALLYGPVNSNTLWTSLPGVCASQNDGDPIVLYDQMADRWFVSQFALPNFPSGPFYQCIAVSKTPDPLGQWHLYQYTVSTTKMNDYPHFGVWPDGYYMAVNQFSAGTLSWAGQGVAVFERDQMLAGGAARMVYADLGAVSLAFGGMLPSDLDGPTAPPAGTPNYFVEVDDDSWGWATDRLQVFEFHVDWQDTASSTFNGPAVVNTSGFATRLCGRRDCVPQPGTTRKLDGLSDRLMHRLAYRNFGTHQTLVANHTVNAGSGRAGVRWYELRRTTGSWSIHQQGTYAPADGLHRWMGSIAMDGQGNVALGYSVSSTAVHPGIRYTGRLAADPLGQLPQGEAVLMAGSGSQTGSGRWGDYSAMSVDPADDCTFWYTQEYYATTSLRSWRTRVGSFAFPGCSGGGPTGADLSVAKTDQVDPVTEGDNVTYLVTVSNGGPEGATGVVLADPLPGGTSLVSATPSQGGPCTGTTTVTCPLGAIGSGGQASVTIVVSTSAPGSLSNTATVSSSSSDPVSGNDSDTEATTVNPSGGGSADVTITVSDFSFTPKNPNLSQGDTVLWTFQGPSTHNATDKSGMGLYASGNQGAGGQYQFTFAGAGRYAYQCRIHPSQMNGTIKVPVVVSPSSGGTGTTFTVTWADSAAPPGYVWDVQVKRPGATRFAKWKNGVTALSATFVPDSGAGTYTFRARLRNPAAGKAAKYSTNTSITVS